MARTLSVSGADAAQSETSGSYVLPAGEYIGKIIDIGPSKYHWSKKAPHNDKEKYPSLDIKFVWEEAGPGDKYVGKKFVDFGFRDFPKFDGGKANPWFYQFYKALGVVFPKDGEDGEVELPDFEELLGESVGVRLKIGDKKNAAGDVTGKRNEVVGYFDPAKGVVASEAADEADAGDDNFTL